jgi:hypothetical protein
MKSKHLYLIAWILTVGAIVYYDMKDCHRLPWPPRIIYAGIAYGLLDLLAFFSEEIAGVMAIGIVIGTFVTNGWKADNPCPGTSSGVNTAQPQTTAFLTGQYNPQDAQNQPPSYGFLAPSTSGNTTTPGPFQGGQYQQPGTILT